LTRSRPHVRRTASCSRVRDGKGTQDEIATLLRFYKFMAKQTPPEGSATDWKAKTDSLVAAVEKLQKGDAGAPEEYKKALNCKACHDSHKPKDE
jgi:hypothetical protein